MARDRVWHVVGIILFTLGMVLGVAFFGSAVWADIEAFLFDSALGADASLPSLRCPVLITRDEIGEVSATFSNPLDRPVRSRVYIRVTDGFITLMREETTFLRLEPGETQRLAWPITSSDAAWGYFILARVYFQRSYPLPSRTATCGVLTLNAPFLTGAQLVWLTVVFTLGSLGLGFYLWYKAYMPLEGRRLQEAYGRAFMMGLVVVGMGLGMLGWWLPGLICLIVLVLLVVLMLARAATEAA